MGNIACFFLNPTNFYVKSLRRYHSADADNRCCGPGSFGYHNAEVIIEPRLELFVNPISGRDHTFSQDDRRWPKVCQQCLYEFRTDDEWQVNYGRLYARTDNQELVTLRDAPAGAMWDASWFLDSLKRADGRYLILRLPGRYDWEIDGSCSNCDRKEEPHECWVRHGEPPLITVDKNGNTCRAGAGSVITSTGYHAMLENGILRQI
jgi:hypothetical protein